MKRIIFQTLLFSFSALSFSQSSVDTFNIIMLSFDYSSNTSTFGTTIDEIKQPNYISSINFISEHKFDISVSSIITSNADSTYSNAAYEHDIMLGYNFDLNKKLSIYPSYTHLFHSKNSYALKSMFTNVFETDLFFTTKNFNSSLSYEFILGEKNMSFACIQGALEFEFNNFLLKNSLTNIQLGLYINYGDNNYYNKIILDNWDSESFISWRADDRPILTSEYLRLIEDYGLAAVKESFYDLNPELFDPDYKITSIDFYLPLYYSIGNFMLNFTTYLSLPTAENEFLTPSNSFFFNAGLSYGISF